MNNQSILARGLRACGTGALLAAASITAHAGGPAGYIGYAPLSQSQAATPVPGLGFWAMLALGLFVAVIAYRLSRQPTNARLGAGLLVVGGSLLAGASGYQWTGIQDAHATGVETKAAEPETCDVLTVSGSVTVDCTMEWSAEEELTDIALANPAGSRHVTGWAITRATNTSGVPLIITELGLTYYGEIGYISIDTDFTPPGGAKQCKVGAVLTPGEQCYIAYEWHGPVAV